MDLKCQIIRLTLIISFRFVKGNVTNGYLSQYGEYIGCYEGDCLSVNSSVTFIWNVTNSHPACSKTCKKMGFTYAGRYKSNICICYRQNACDTHSMSRKCGLPCPRNEEAGCGGVNWMPVNKEGKHFGCYLEDCFHITYARNITNPLDTCTNACRILSFTYAGLYNTDVIVCVCSGQNACHTHEEDKCGVPCHNDEYRFCGGQEWMAVYKLAETSVVYTSTDKGETQERVIPILFSIGVCFVGALSACAFGIAVFVIKRHGRGERYYPKRESYRHRMRSADLPSDPSTRLNNDLPGRHTAETDQSRNEDILNEPDRARISNPNDIAETSLPQSTTNTLPNYHGRGSDQGLNQQNRSSRFSNRDQLLTSSFFRPTPSSKCIKKPKGQVNVENYPRMNQFLGQQLDGCSGDKNIDVQCNLYDSLEKACGEKGYSEVHQESGRYSVIHLQSGNTDDSVYLKLERGCLASGSRSGQAEVKSVPDMTCE